MALEIMTVASSSKGNCTIIRNGSVTLLIDMGIPLSHLKAALNNFAISIEEIDGVLITHEHTDHISGLKCLLKKFNIPVYAERNTMNYVARKLQLDCVRNFDISESGFSVGNIDIQPFRTRHDAIYSFGFSFMSAGDKISVSTDLGCMTPGVLNNLKGSDIVLIESNHDVDMLRKGDYPYHLKKRILGSEGHLSNEVCAETVLELSESGTETFILGHLSENNNTRRLAYSTTAEKLLAAGVRIGQDVTLDVAGSRFQYLSYTAKEKGLKKII